MKKILFIVSTLVAAGIASYAAAFVCQPSAGERRLVAGDTGIVGPCGYCDDAGIYACGSKAVAFGARGVSSAGLTWIPAN